METKETFCLILLFWFQQKSLQSHGQKGDPSNFLPKIMPTFSK